MANQIALRIWGDQCVAYDPQSGDTHLLSALGGQVLLGAEDGVHGFDELVARASKITDASPDAEFVTNLRTIVAELQTRGLLSRSCCSPN